MRGGVRLVAGSRGVRLSGGDLPEIAAKRDRIPAICGERLQLGSGGAGPERPQMDGTDDRKRRPGAT